MVFHRALGKIMGVVFAAWILAGWGSVAAAQDQVGTSASPKKSKSVMKQITEKVIETVTGKGSSPKSSFSKSLNEGAEEASGNKEKKGSNVLKEAFKKLVETPGDKKKQEEESTSTASSPVNKKATASQARSTQTTAKKEEDKGIIEKTLDVLISPGDEKKPAPPAAKPPVKAAQKQAPATKPAQPKVTTAKKEEDKGIIEKTLDVLISPGDEKKPAPPAAKPPVKAARKQAPAAKPVKPKVTTVKKEESNIIHETLKNIISPSDDKKEAEVAQNSLKPAAKDPVENANESLEAPKGKNTNVLKEAFKKLVATPGDEKKETP